MRGENKLFSELELIRFSVSSFHNALEIERGKESQSLEA